ncbi:putative enzyme related to lactoylglutathione lyase [Tumebacillus sp. BK434]|uniref:VOC family protein n=1 Tax=Tumebacillus sp. BK434 TaxID=2512169 RepID=UPI00104B3F62|nr:VOC family protein [Tumebacillus sp. BK434]TCP54748.1 putative enzyme related to lactoylglutathione lyase [Tumebacillus sp. BK434]
MSELYKRIDTVFLPVRDLEASVAWYAEHLGMKQRWKVNGYAALDIAGGETPLTLCAVAEGEDVRPSARCVFNLYAADIQAAYQKLKDGGVTLSEMFHDDVDWFEFRDPDGHVLGVCHFAE